MMEKFNNGKLYAHKVFLKGVLADIEHKKLSSNCVIRRQKIYWGKTQCHKIAPAKVTMSAVAL